MSVKKKDNKQFGYLLRHDLHILEGVVSLSNTRILEADDLHILEGVVSLSNTRLTCILEADGNDHTSSSSIFRTN